MFLVSNENRCTNCTAVMSNEKRSETSIKYNMVFVAANSFFYIFQVTLKVLKEVVTDNLIEKATIIVVIIEENN